MDDRITAEDVFLNGADLISDSDGEASEYDRGIAELTCTLVGLNSDRKYEVLAYLRSVKRFEADKARMVNTLYRANVN